MRIYVYLAMATVYMALVISVAFIQLPCLIDLWMSKQKANLTHIAIIIQIYVAVSKLYS